MLLRITLALAAAVTVWIAGWAGLQALKRPAPIVASAPGEIAIPPAATNVPPAVVKPTPPHRPQGRAADASASRPTEPRFHPLRVDLGSHSPTIPLVVTLRDGWSNAPLVRRAVDASVAAAGGLELARVPAGEHWLVAAADAAGESYLSRTRVTVPSSTAVAVDLRLSSLRVRVVEGNTPRPRVLVQLSRADDPAWVQPMPATGALSLTDRDGAVSIGPLGPGRYRAAVIGEAARPHDAQHKARSGADSIEVELPATTEVLIDLAQER